MEYARLLFRKAYENGWHGEKSTCIYGTWLIQVTDLM